MPISVRATLDVDTLAHRCFSRTLFRSLRTEVRTEYLCVRLQLHQLVAIGRERTRTAGYSLVQ